MSRMRPAAGISRGCCAWSRASWTGVTGEAHAAEACAADLGAGCYVCGRIPVTDRISLGDRAVL